MAASAVGVDRVAEREGVVVPQGVDDALGADVEELEAAVLADADLALEDGLLEQRALRLVRPGDLPAEPLGHAAEASRTPVRPAPGAYATRKC